jgi:hypothetical protein
MSQLISGALVLVASAAVGAFVGWLVGASNTPVVAALIPLTFGLTGVLWQRYTELKERLKAATDVPAREGVERSIDLVGARPVRPDEPGGTAPLVSLAVITFVAASFIGVQRGIDMRVPRLPPLSELVAGDTTLDHREAATLARLRLDLTRMRVSADEAREVFGATVVRMLRRKEFAAGGALRDVRPDALREIARQIVPTAPTPQAGRGPASDTLPSGPPADDTR